MVEKLTRQNLILPVAIIIAGVFIAGSVIYVNLRVPSVKMVPERKIKAEVLPSEQVAEKVINYINQNVLRGGQTASLIAIAEEAGVYKIHLKIGEREYDSYATKDGRFLFPEGYDMEKILTQKEVEGKPEEVPKREVPDVKLFVMSYCPFGLQAQKMFLPVYDLLKGKVEMGVYFVDYIMHGKKEIDENLRQYCIQKEEREKYDEYLGCFVTDGNFQRCLEEAQIDKEKLENCISETDQEFKITPLYNDKSTWLNGRFPKFGVHSDLNKKYGVRGSPTIVINDQITNINPRSPEKFKEVVCGSFDLKPKECSRVLSGEAFSPGFGAEKTSSSGGSCE